MLSSAKRVVGCALPFFREGYEYSYAAEFLRVVWDHTVWEPFPRCTTRNSPLGPPACPPQVLDLALSRTSWQWRSVQQAYVARCFEEGDVGFFPKGRALHAISA